MAPTVSNIHHQASKTSSVGRLEALEADIAVLKAERALDILTSTLAKWIDQFYAAEKPILGATAPDEAHAIPDSFKDDVSRALADQPSASSLLQAPNLWPALQEVYHEVLQERQRRLHQSLAVVNTIMREAKSQEKRMLRKKNVAKNQRQAAATVTAQGDGDISLNPYQPTDFHPAHCAASTHEPVTNNENSNSKEANVKECTDSDIPEGAPTHEVVSTEPPVVLEETALPDPQQGGGAVTSTGNPIPAGQKTLIPKRGRRRLMPGTQGKKGRGAVKVGTGLKAQEAHKATLDEFVIPVDPLSAIMHSIVPAYLSDDDHKIFGEMHGFDRRRIPQIESDSGVATRPRRSRKGRKMPKAP